MLIVSVDGGCAGVKNVKAGIIAATAQQYPLKMASLGVDAAVEYAKTGTKGRRLHRYRRDAHHRQTTVQVDSKDTTFGLDACWGAKSSRVESPARARATGSTFGSILGAAGRLRILRLADGPLPHRTELLADPAAGDGGQRHGHWPDRSHSHSGNRFIVRDGDGARFHRHDQVRGRSGMNPYLAIAGGLLGCIAFGLLNGALITYVRLPPFIVTLGTLNIAFAITQIYSQSQTVSGLPDALLFFGTTFRIGETAVTYGTVLMLGMYLAAWWSSVRRRRAGTFMRSAAILKPHADGNPVAAPARVRVHDCRR